MTLAEITGSNATATITFLHPDSLNSTSFTTDISSTPSQTLVYSPYGSTLASDAPQGSTRRQFIGQATDPQTALSYLNARYYQGSVGRFLSEDPILQGPPALRFLLDPQQVNAYGYARNNPINGSDPSGLFVISTGLVEKGDQLKSIRDQINKAYGTSYTNTQLASMSGFANPDVIPLGGYIKGYLPAIQTSVSTPMYSSVSLSSPSTKATVTPGTVCCSVGETAFIAGSMIPLVALEALPIKVTTSLMSPTVAAKIVPEVSQMMKFMPKPPMGWDEIPYLNMSTAGKVVFGTGATIAIINWAYKITNGPADVISDVSQGP